MEKRIWDLNFDSDEAEIMQKLKELITSRVNNTEHQNERDDVSINYALQLLNLKQQQKLVQEQKNGNHELVKSTKWLAYATIGLAIITAIIGLASLFAK